MNSRFATLKIPRTLGLLAITTMASVGCDAPSGNTGNTVRSMHPDGSTGVAMGPPVEWLNLRSVDPDSLELVFTLDGIPQVSSRDANNRWSVSFSLPDNNTHTVRATWQETLPDRVLILAVSEELPVSNLQPERRLSISEYLHRQFDDDNDGISNLDERRLDLDPLVANLVTPAANQTDCRVNTASIQFGNFFVDVDAPAFAAPLSLTSTATIPNLNNATTEGMFAVFESFFVLTPGVLTVSHFGGPARTGAILYDTDSNNMLREVARDNIPLMSAGVGFEDRRAVITAQVQPGLYCYRMESTRANEPIISPELQYSFIADRERSAAAPQSSDSAVAPRASAPRIAMHADLMLQPKED